MCLYNFLLLLRTPKSPLFPYTTLFRSSLKHPSPFASRCRCQAYERGKTTARLPIPLGPRPRPDQRRWPADRKSTRLNSSHSQISYAVFCLKKKIYKSDSDIQADQNTVV